MAMDEVVGKQYCRLGGFDVEVLTRAVLLYPPRSFWPSNSSITGIIQEGGFFC